VSVVFIQLILNINNRKISDIITLMNENKTIIKYIYLPVIAVLIFVTGIFVGKNSASAWYFQVLDATKPENVDFSPVWKVWHILDAKFVPPVDPDKKLGDKEKIQERVWGMAQGLAASTGDPYTVFMPPSDNKIFNEDISGEFEGVGMEITIKNGVLTVVSPLKGAPAEKAGIKAGDIITKIDGKSTENLSLDKAVKLIRGPKGTEVELEILREGESDFIKIKVKRDKIKIPVIETKKLDNGIFVIELMSFTENSPQLFKNALVEFINSKSDKLILDLRGNPGGYLEAAVDIASWFLEPGALVVTEDFAGKRPNIERRSKGYNIFPNGLNMVVLIDKGSASASEILAGSLKAHNKAKLVGRQSFGKGSVQELIKVTKDTSLKVTIARWVLPDGTRISGKGIKPDIEVELPDKKEMICDSNKVKEFKEKDAILDRAIQYLKSGK